MKLRVVSPDALLSETLDGLIAVCGLARATDADRGAWSLVDVSDGLELLVEEVAERPAEPILAIRWDNEPHDCTAALAAGAFDCLHFDDLEPSDLIAALDRAEAIRAGREAVDAEAAALLPRLQLMQHIFGITSSTELAPEDQIQEILELGSALFGETMGIVSRIVDDVYTVEHIHAPGADIGPGTQFAFAETFCEITLRSEGPLGIEDVSRSEWKSHPCTGSGLLSYIGVPIRVDGEPFGTLNFSSPHAHHSRFYRSDLAFIATLGEWVGTVLTRKKTLQELENLAHYDRLTGLPNRGAFLERLDRSAARARRGGYRFALLFIDLDGFKQVNDQHGHLVGDGLLQEVAAILRYVVRPKDEVARFGGDEFVLLLEDADVAVAHTVAARVREHLAAPIEIEGIGVTVGASVGIALSAGDEPAAQIIEAADQAMFADKRARSGR